MRVRFYYYDIQLLYMYSIVVYIFYKIVRLHQDSHVRTIVSRFIRVSVLRFIVLCQRNNTLVWSVVAPQTTLYSRDTGA